MKEIVERILREEQQARERIQAAKQESDAMLDRARNDARKMIADADAECIRLLGQKRKAATDEYNAAKDRDVARVREDEALRHAQRKQDIPALAAKIFTRVVG